MLGRAFRQDREMLRFVLQENLCGCHVEDWKEGKSQEPVANSPAGKPGLNLQGQWAGAARKACLVVFPLSPVSCIASLLALGLPLSTDLLVTGRQCL